MTGATNATERLHYTSDLFADWLAVYNEREYHRELSPMHQYLLRARLLELHGELVALITSLPDASDMVMH